MPRKARDERLNTRTARLELTPNREPYWRTIQEGRAIGYRRLAGGKAGSWIARHYDAKTGRVYHALGTADDMSRADGVDTLDFGQAQDAARKWFDELALQGGKVIKPLTVRQAVEAYLDDYVSRGGKALSDVRATFNAHVLPVFGDTLVKDLTSETIKRWHHGLANAPARLRSKKAASKPKARAPAKAGTDEKRARRSSANRILTNLKAALSLCFRDGKVENDKACGW